MEGATGSRPSLIMLQVEIVKFGDLFAVAAENRHTGHTGNRLIWLMMICLLAGHMFGASEIGERMSAKT